MILDNTRIKSRRLRPQTLSTKKARSNINMPNAICAASIPKAKNNKELHKGCSKSRIKSK